MHRSVWPPSPGCPSCAPLPPTLGLADPLEIAELTALEFLELEPVEWCVLLDAEAVPRSRSAASITAYGTEDLLSIAAIANELLALWHRPQIIHTTLEGELGPVP
ncbi:hypothetical protein ACWGVR_10565 [Streptomyces xanthophaeus]